MFPDRPAVASSELVWNELLPPTKEISDSAACSSGSDTDDSDGNHLNRDIFTLTVDVEKGVAVSSNSNLRWV